MKLFGFGELPAGGPVIAQPSEVGVLLERGRALARRDVDVVDEDAEALVRPVAHVGDGDLDLLPRVGGEVDRPLLPAAGGAAGGVPRRRSSRSASTCRRRSASGSARGTDGYRASPPAQLSPARPSRSCGRWRRPASSSRPGRRCGPRPREVPVGLGAVRGPEGQGGARAAGTGRSSGSGACTTRRRSASTRSRSPCAGRTARPPGRTSPRSCCRTAGTWRPAGWLVGMNEALWSWFSALGAPNGHGGASAKGSRCRPRRRVGPSGAVPASSL